MTAMANAALIDQVASVFKRACREHDWEVAVFLFQVFKPPGLTHWASSLIPRTGEPPVSLAAPRWVKLALLTVLSIAALLLAMLSAGSHGPSAYP